MPQVGVFYPLEEIVSGETAAAFSDAAPANSAEAEMAENNFDAATEAHGQGDESSPEEPFDKDRALAKISKANAEAKNLRKRVKELEQYEQMVREMEDAKKSEIEKATEKLTRAEQRAKEAEDKLMRLEVAMEKGLTPAQAKRLVGSTKEELLADADELLASFAPKTSEPERKIPEVPREMLRGGGEPTDPPEETDPRKIADLIPRPR